jgi:hypothetical protein
MHCHISPPAITDQRQSLTSSIAETATADHKTSSMAAWLLTPLS